MLSFLAAFDLNTYSYSGLTIAKGKEKPQVPSFSYRIVFEQDVRKIMNFAIWKKKKVEMLFSNGIDQWSHDYTMHL